MIGIVVSCILFVTVIAEKNCNDALRCPNAPFDSSVLIDYNEGVMTMHSDYMDIFCAYLAEAVVCTKDYEAVCNPHTNTLFKMMRNSYNPVCKEYKTELAAMISPCFNEPSYQQQIQDCYSTAGDMKREQTTTSENCGHVDYWASCTHALLLQCSPENAHVIFPIVEASKPELCQL